MGAKRSLNDIIVLIRGGGEMASGVAHRLHRSHFKVCIVEIPNPLAVRRGVSFCEAIFDGTKEVEGVRAQFVERAEEISPVWEEGKIPLLIDPEARMTRGYLTPDVVVDAIMAKKNLGTSINDAPLVIGLGPGFRAGRDVHVVIETNRGHNLGRVIVDGEAEPDTGIPGEVGGYTVERLLRSPGDGIFEARAMIGDLVEKGEVVAVVDGFPLVAQLRGIVRGLIRDGTEVRKGMKVGDIDPRGKREYCFTVSDKARAIAGGVLEAIMERFNR